MPLDRSSGEDEGGRQRGCLNRFFRASMHSIIASCGDRIRTQQPHGLLGGGASGRDHTNALLSLALPNHQMVKHVPIKQLAS
jgi:hypothetical protein